MVLKISYHILLSNKHVINNMTATRTHANFSIKINNMIVSNSLLSDR
jgi:hypothetical protein